MARVGSVFVCSMCDEKISDETFSCKLRKGNAYVSGENTLKIQTYFRI
jgi:hypothetical protein